MNVCLLLRFSFETVISLDFTQWFISVRTRQDQKAVNYDIMKKKTAESGIGSQEHYRKIKLW